MEDKDLLKPANWGILLILAIMKLCSYTPRRTLVGIVVVMGVIIKPFMRSRNRVAQQNLRLAFPEKSEMEIKKLVNESYKSLILSGAETTIGWLGPRKKFREIKFEWDGDSLKRYKEYHNNPDRAFIVLGSHFHCMDLIGRYLGDNHSPFTVMYQKNSNNLIEYFIKKYREKSIYKCIDSKNFIGAVRSLKRGYTMWYAPDQDFGLENSGLENSIFVPFFGRMCATLTVTSWLAKKTNAIVAPIYYVREECLKKYKIVLGEEIIFTGDDYKDARMINKFLEDAIRKYPEQYLWQHRRYRTRPNGESQIY